MSTSTSLPDAMSTSTSQADVSLANAPTADNAPAAANTPVAVPPSAIYSSMKEALDGVNAWARANGCAFRVGRSRYSKSRYASALFECVRAGAPPKARSEPQRQSTSIRCNCDYSVVAEELPDGQWLVKHRGESFSRHNHPLVHIPGAFHQHRVMSEATEATIINQSDAGIPPRKMLQNLRATATEPLHITSKDLYNTISTQRRERRDGRAPTAFAISSLLQDKAYVRTRRDAQHNITDLFWAFPQSLEYFRLYPDILVVDCTYNTNGHRLPLFEIVAVDAMERTFCVAFAFLSHEAEPDFCWVFQELKIAFLTKGIDKLPKVIATDRDLASLNAIIRSFPHARPVICLWHANMAVEGHCKPVLGGEKWKAFQASWLALVDSRTIDEYDANWALFRETYEPEFKKLVEYVQNQWLRYKEYIVRAWTDTAPHFGIRTTGRAEGQHSLLKRHLVSTENTLDVVVQVVRGLVDNQLQQIAQQQGVQQLSFPSEAPPHIFGAVQNYLSHEAVRHTLQQISSTSNEPCTGSYRRSMGLPCAHELKYPAMLQLDQFDEHWHLKCTAPPPLVLDPISKKEQKKPRKSTTSTGRIRTVAQAQLLDFERSEARRVREEGKKEKQQQREQRQHVAKRRRTDEARQQEQQVIQQQTQQQEGTNHSITWIEPVTTSEMKETGRVPQRIAKLDRVGK